MREEPEPANRRILVMGVHLWILTVMFVIGTIFHYPEESLLPSISPALGLTRHALERILFLLPISYASFIFGMRGFLAATTVALAIMLPRAILISSVPRDAVVEVCAVIIVGGLVNLWFELYRREKNRTQQALQRLAAAQGELQSYLKSIRRNERRLAALNEVSDVLGQSLELETILRAAADKVAEVMEVEVVLAFLLDEKNQGLEPRIHLGVSKELVAELSRLKVGEGFNGQVAQTGEPLVVKDASADPRLTREVVRKEGIRAEIIAPLKAEGRVTGTLCVATRGPREFVQEDVELLCHIASHIGVAVDNARLYYNQRIMAEQIASDAEKEKQMRESLTFYLQQVTRAQEEERRRIARELHDETAQDLVALSRRLDILVAGGKGLSSQDVVLLEELRQQADKALEGVRRFSQDLRPSILDDLGLVPALEWLAADLEQHFGINIEVQVTGLVNRFAPEVELVLFRIAQEALRNVWKHSEASEARVVLEYGDDGTLLTINDNGKGFELPERVADLAPLGKLGLVGMQERVRLLGGSLEMLSEPGRGTSIKVVLPKQVT